jgi:hypothetical protein
MALMARQMILPAAVQHQTGLARAVAATMQAGVACKDQQVALQEFVNLVYRFNLAISARAEADNEPLKQARYLCDTVIPLMNTVRELGDQLEMNVAADLWPIPSYRELLFSLSAGPRSERRSPGGPRFAGRRRFGRFAEAAGGRAMPGGRPAPQIRGTRRWPTTSTRTFT